MYLPPRRQPATPPGETTPPKGPPPQTIPLFAGGTNAAPGGLALVGERGPELVNLPQGAQVFTNTQTNSILQTLALRSFATGTTNAPAGVALVGERGPELVQLLQNRSSNAQPARNEQSQANAQFMTELARSLSGKAHTMQQAGDVMADMLISAATANVQAGMLRQLSRR